MSKVKRRVKTAVVQSLIYAFMAFSLFMTFLPIFITIFNAFKSDYEIMTDVFAPPAKFLTDGFGLAWGHVSHNLLNGVFIAFVAGLLNTVGGSILAYIFQQKQFYAKELIYKFYIFIMLIPSLVGLPVVYALITKMHLINNYLSIWLTSFSGGQVGALFLFRTFLGQQPSTVYEAARIDGAGDVQIYLTISVPLAFPIMVLSFLGVFSGCYNDYFWPTLAIKDPDLQPIMAVLKRFADSYKTQNLKVPYAMYLISSIPLIFTAAISMKFFSSGDFAAGMKM